MDACIRLTISRAGFAKYESSLYSAHEWVRNSTVAVSNPQYFQNSAPAERAGRRR